MKYLPHLYARALTEVLDKTPEKNKSEILKKFIQTVKKNGDFPQIEKITEALQDIAVKNNGGKKIKIEFARNGSDSQLKEITKKFSTKDSIETCLNKDLIAGVRITVDNEKELDNSLEKKLKQIFN